MAQRELKMSSPPPGTNTYFLLMSEVLDGYCAIFKMPEGMRDIHKPGLGVRMGDAYPPGLRFQMAKEEKGLKIADVIPNALGYLMVSARMKALLVQHGGGERSNFFASRSSTTVGALPARTATSPISSEPRIAWTWFGAKGMRVSSTPVASCS
ncbi:hypothetical protein D7V88_17000 [Corallococcus terminator]|uniref:Uncharacterized protein n=1 Tax=Corallococcus terminator TaxID=2316733 RepID=A0A3A8JBU1_9BACT|nr:hypothetical protein D7V88_17000 [Corallococcus terminator]